MNWTKEQQQAIDERGRNILVAAAAGSGKTAVLVERIKKLVIEDGVPIDRMLIVTFTNAAAAEMKEKIRTALYKEIDKDPYHAEKLREQLNLLLKANISTFHAFALEAIRKFFYLTDVEPGFSICDDAQRTILKEDAMDFVMETWFAEGSPEFYDFLNWYSGDRNQNKIRLIVDSSYSILQSLPYPWKWLSEKVEALSMSRETFVHSPIMTVIRNFVIQSAEDGMDYVEKAAELLAEAGLDRLAEKENEELAVFTAIKEAAQLGDLENLGQCVTSFKAVRLSAKKEEKEAYEAVKGIVSAYRKKGAAQISQIKELLFVDSFDVQIEEMNQTAGQGETLQRLLLDFDAAFKSAKAEKRLIDFNDIEHLCLQILENPQAADHYRKKFEYIFVDEYQDTNILQEEIISRIKRENNLFMVGDVKQSIYKFRLAEPEIFKSRYKAYSGETEQSVKIDLNRNFRSKPVILSEINRIFEGLMEDYDDDARLYPGIDYQGQLRYLPKAEVVDAASANEADEELAKLKNTELEALAVCRLIKENLGKPFFDQKLERERPISMRDIAVLMRGVRNYADVFYRIFKENGIESFVDSSEGYFDTMEINVFMNLLSVIDNKQQDVQLISVLHSEIFGFSADDLAKVRAEYKTGSFAGALRAFAEQGTDEELQSRCADVLSAISAWKAQAGTMPLGKFIWRLLLDTGYYMQMGAMPAGQQRQANLRALVDKAEKYGQDRQNSLYSFVRYIDSVKDRNVPMGQVKLVGENDDLVRIMTIHKSKGLEFPMVIVSGMGRRLNYTKIGSGVVMHKDIGIGMSLVNYEKHWYKQTLLQRLIARQVHREEVQEEIRILYVALTRARDLLFMTGTVRDGEKFRENREVGLWSDTTYLDMAQQVSSLDILDANILSAGTACGEMRFGNPVDWDIYDGQAADEEVKEIGRRLSFIYPYEKARRHKSKYSVTELNRNRIEAGDKNRELRLAVPGFRQGERSFTAAERGTIYHGIMERIDFQRAEKEGLAYLQTAASDYIAREIFLQEEIDAINLSRIDEFFRTDLGKRCAEAAGRGSLQRERPFDLLMEEEGEPVIVQGIIDCYFEEDGAMVLIDYKTSWIDLSKDFEDEAARLRNEYLAQIEIYKKALGTALGKPVKEACLYLFGPGKSIKM